MRKPLCIDMYAGLGGWTEGFLAEGWDVIGFDIERHVYGEQRYPAQLVLQDVRTIHGRQFRHSDCIVASPPCQEFSYMAMPWSRAKQIAGALREEVPFPEGYIGSRTVAELTALFDACFRIQREAIEATRKPCVACTHSAFPYPACVRCGGRGFTERYIPMVVENVKGAQPWVGKARANFGSFCFWGDVAMVGGRVVAGGLKFGDFAKAARCGMKRNPDGTEHPQGSWFAVADSKERGANGTKVDGFNFHQFEKTGEPGGSFQSAAVATKGFVTGLGKDRDWRQDPTACFNSKSPARKAASAQIAKIPFPLSSYIARCFKPPELRETRPSPARVPDPARA